LAHEQTHKSTFVPPSKRYHSSFGTIGVSELQRNFLFIEKFDIQNINSNGNSESMDVHAFLVGGLSVIAENKGHADATITIFIQESEDGVHFSDKENSTISIDNDNLFGRVNLDLYSKHIRLRWVVSGTTINWSIAVTLNMKE
jgi:hypothetical protein